MEKYTDRYGTPLGVGDSVVVFLDDFTENPGYKWTGPGEAEIEDIPDGGLLWLVCFSERCDLRSYGGSSMIHHTRIIHIDSLPIHILSISR